MNAVVKVGRLSEVGGRVQRHVRVKVGAERDMRLADAVRAEAVGWLHGRRDRHAGRGARGRPIVPQGVEVDLRFSAAECLQAGRHPARGAHAVERHAALGAGLLQGERHRGRN